MYKSCQVVLLLLEVYSHLHPRSKVAISWLQSVVFVNRNYLTLILLYKQLPSSP